MAIFVNEDYKNYKYLVGAYENYVILTNRSSVNGSYENREEINIIYQYFYPSTYTIESTKIYANSTDFQRIDISQDFFDRADACQILSISFIVLFFFLFILNGFTRVFKKGGMFFGN